MDGGGLKLEISAWACILVGTMRSPRLAPILLLLFTAALPAHARSRKPGLLEQAESAANRALVPAPQDQEVCFSPEEPCDVKLVKFVQLRGNLADAAI